MVKIVKNEKIISKTGIFSSERGRNLLNSFFMIFESGHFFIVLIIKRKAGRKKKANPKTSTGLENHNPVPAPLKLNIFFTWCHSGGLISA